MLLRISRKIFHTILGKLHQKDLYLYGDIAEGWVKKGKVNLNDEDTIFFDPYVYFHDGQYYMYVSNRTKNCISLFISEDGEKWCNEIVVLKGTNNKNSWECCINRACVVKKSSEYIMYYTGQQNNSSNIGIAKSNDGIHFERIKCDPILTPYFTFEKNSVMNPCVLWDNANNKYKMWYSAGEIYEPDVICYAESYDGIIWEKNDSPILGKSANKYDCCKVGGCDVHIFDGKYIMFYIGYQNVDLARICVAYSEDGITNWIRCNINPVVSPTKHSWDSHSVYKPSVIIEDNKVLLFYNGRKNYIESIGLVEKGGSLCTII